MNNIPSVRFNPPWSPYAGNTVRGLIELMCDIYSLNTNDQTWIEIGTFVGESSLIISSFPFVKKLHCVDPLIDKFKNILDQRLKHGILSNQIYLHNTTSEIYNKNILDYSIDGIYIDGCHKKECIETDINIWHQKIKHNGFLCGHDYSLKRWPDVYAVVNDFVAKYGYVLNTYMDTSWMIQVNHKI